MNHVSDTSRLSLRKLRAHRIAGLVLLIGGMGCGRQPESSSLTPGDGPNILLITVDTLRADHLGAWGYERIVSPAIDALVSESLVFERAYAPAPWTLPSIASIHTGLYPTSHTIEGPSNALPNEVATLAEILGSAGWRTVSVTSNALLSERLGFGQGFEVYETGDAIDHAHVSTPGVTQAAKQHLARFAQSDQPFFLSVLYFDPPYDWLSHGSGRIYESPP